jgi:hypothetical protein
MTVIPTSQRTCPCCPSRRVSRSHRRGIFERYLLSSVRIRPYRCDECDSRFYKSDLPFALLHWLVESKKRFKVYLGKAKSHDSKPAAA